MRRSRLHPHAFRLLRLTGAVTVLLFVAVAFTPLTGALDRALALEPRVEPAGVIVVAGVFVSWAVGGFGALSHEYATALGFTLVAVGTQVMLGSFFLGLLTMRTTEPSRATIVDRAAAA